MTYKKASVGLILLFIAQIILFVSTLLVIIGEVMLMINVNTEIEDTVKALFAAFSVGVQMLDVLAMFVVYFISLIGIIFAMIDERKFRSTLLWLILSSVLYIVIEIIDSSGGNLYELSSMMANMVMMVITVSGIDGCIAMLENIGELDKAALSEKRIVSSVLFYMFTIIFDLCVMVFKDLMSYVNLYFLMDILSDSLKFAACITFIVVLRRTSKALKALRARQKDGTAKEEGIAQTA